MSVTKPMRLVFGEALVELADEYPHLVVCDADVSSSTQTKLFGRAYPERFFNFGVAEANMVSAAAGMAAAGLMPVVSTFAFLLATRASDAVRSLVAYNSLNVKLAGGYSGLSDYADGASHQSVMDISLMRAMPNMTVIVPSDITETRMAVKAMLEYEGPVFLRLLRESVGEDYGEDHPFRIGEGIALREGGDVAIIAAGLSVNAAMAAADTLAVNGVRARVIDMHTIKPIDESLIVAAAGETGAIVAVEENSLLGGLGSAVCEVVCQRCPVPVVRVGIPDRFGESGPYAEILSRAGLDEAHIVNAAEEAIRKKKVMRESEDLK
ncbi:MAG: transketolase family protein [Planctomycetota bacterium]|jgi:transketolase